MTMKPGPRNSKMNPENAETRAAEPYLRIEGLTKMFGAFTALEDISLEV